MKRINILIFIILSGVHNWFLEHNFFLEEKFLEDIILVYFTGFILLYILLNFIYRYLSVGIVKEVRTCENNHKKLGHIKYSLILQNIFTSKCVNVYLLNDGQEDINLHSSELKKILNKKIFLDNKCFRVIERIMYSGLSSNNEIIAENVGGICFTYTSQNILEKEQKIASNEMAKSALTSNFSNPKLFKVHHSFIRLVLIRVRY